MFLSNFCLLLLTLDPLLAAQVNFLLPDRDGTFQFTDEPVAAPHRKAAFAACEWLIRELKRTVPIWKKEVYADGEEWIDGETL